MTGVFFYLLNVGGKFGVEKHSIKIFEIFILKYRTFKKGEHNG